MLLISRCALWLVVLAFYTLKLVLCAALLLLCALLLLLGSWHPAQPCSMPARVCFHERERESVCVCVCVCVCHLLLC
jgi:hypothetical protein